MRRLLIPIITVAVILMSSCSRKVDFEIEKGVNIAHWLSQSFVRGEARAAYFTEADVRQIAEWGFDHVRIPIDEVQMFHEDGTKDEEAFQLLHNALDLCGKYDLRAVVDLHILRSHNFNAQDKPLFYERAAQEAFYECWRQISGELKDYPVDMVAYELMNEPVADDPEDWNKIVGECYSAVRELEEKRVIVIGSNMWQSFNTASQLALPEDDPNIILSFHYYNPMLLSHYQASWMDLREYTGPVTYPGDVVTPEEFESLSDRNMELAKPYAGQQYGKNRFAAEFGEVVAVAKKYGIPVYCGEYGCLSVESNAESRYRWLTDMNDVFDSLSIARAVWCYREGPVGFGILSSGSDQPDRKMLECLLD